MKIQKLLVFLLAFVTSVASAANFPLFSPATGVLKGNANTYVTTAATSSDIYGLWTGTCNATTFLRGDGTCTTITLTTDVTGILPAANGGNGNGFFAVSGPASSTKTFTFPNASATVLTDNASVTATQGGTGQSTYATGDTLYASAANTLSKLPGNTTTTKNFYTQTGTGAASQAPAWGTITAADILNLSVTWTGTEIFNGATTTGTSVAGVSLGQNSNHGYAVWVDTTAGANAHLWRTITGATSMTTQVVNDAGSTTDVMKYTRSAAALTNVTLGNSTDNPSYTFSGSGLVTATGYASAGTKFTATGCSNSTTVGGATAGRFTSGTTGTCTVVITLPTATNGWACSASDMTTPANPIVQSASSTTSCTVSGTTVTGDVISFLAIGY